MQFSASKTRTSPINLRSTQCPFSDQINFRRQHKFSPNKTKCTELPSQLSFLENALFTANDRKLSQVTVLSGSLLPNQKKIPPFYRVLSSVVKTVKLAWSCNHRRPSNVGSRRFSTFQIYQRLTGPAAGPITGWSFPKSLL